MIKVNLLPFRAARKKENIRRQVSVFLLSFILIFILLFVVNMHLGGKIKRLNKEITQLNADLKKYEEINKKINTIKKKLATLEKKTNVIKQLDKNRFEPVQLLDTMSNRVIPKRMWLTTLTERGNTVNLRGMALDNQTVADFMTRLEQSGSFSQVRLKTIQAKRIKGNNLKQFNISCTKKTNQNNKQKTSKKK